MNEPENALVPVPLLRALVRYLVNQPYREVADVLARLQQCEPEPAPTEEAPSDS